MCDFSESSSGIASRERSRHHELSELAPQLIAWLDHELSEAEAAVVEEHIRGCDECRRRVDAYERVSGGFGLYCEALEAASAAAPVSRGSRAHSSVLRWPPVLAGTAAVAGVLFITLSVAFFAGFPGPRIEHSAAPVQTTTVSATIASGAASRVAGSPISPSVDAAVRVSANRAGVVRATAAGRTVPAPQAEARGFQNHGVQNRAFRDRAFRGAFRNNDWQLVQPAIQIAIPAEAMFPPGAVPDGVNFTADLTISTDGSTQGLVLEPSVIASAGSGGSRR
jgi:anti-sigma factor RsiW